MTVEELIEKLKTLPKKTKVHAYIDRLQTAPEVYDAVVPEYNQKAVFLYLDRRAQGLNK